jgi:hypothetical protein
MTVCTRGELATHRARGELAVAVDDRTPLELPEPVLFEVTPRAAERIGECAGCRRWWLSLAHGRLVLWPGLDSATWA